MNYWTQGQFRSARIILGLTRVELAQELDCGLRTVERCDAEGCRKVMALAMMQLNACSASRHNVLAEGYVIKRDTLFKTGD
jgi:hypothetical protein